MKQYLSIEQVAKILGKAVETVKTETSRSPQNLPPFAKIGGAIRFDPDLIEPWFNSKLINHSVVADVLPAKKTGRPVKAASRG